MSGQCAPSCAPEPSVSIQDMGYCLETPIAADGLCSSGSGSGSSSGISRNKEEEEPNSALLSSSVAAAYHYHPAATDAKYQESDVLFFLYVRDFPRFKQCVKQHPAAVHYRDFHGNTPLLVAAYMGLRKVVRYLVRRGAVISAANDFGCTALHFAHEFHYPEIITYLLKKGKNEHTYIRNAFGYGWDERAPKDDPVLGGPILRGNMMMTGVGGDTHGAHGDASKQCLLLPLHSAPVMIEVE